ncbi:alpha/beta fold hydrolase [Goodfellowiella coeruleoviolacea]|uniref:Pimeloyl-ACP methyl ester carboxylesterase n=1 Tax=Goodfellowiella coeruleoviolacea TaxID=334858 RepID=A0AAE3GDW3_9PSEU|nr:alpha/beta hydrolase [Goodfellowiella coeruleoviolacea]MCP2166457.1 Pimeloyl-ACP methyl ester carboxylesterase [Goodfellowiella coeruleoviolacea]
MDSPRPGLARRGFLRGLGGVSLGALLAAGATTASPTASAASPAAAAPARHRFLRVNNIRVHVVEAGTGPLVLLLHGWPETWYSWRHQIPALARAGFRVVVPDQRGYGWTDRPGAVTDYDIEHLVDDITGLIDVLGERQAYVVGHDWGAIVAWHTALLRPERVRAVAALSVPHRWAEPAGSLLPVESLRATYGDHFYIVYFQRPGLSDVDLASDPRTLFRRMLYTGSGDGPGWNAMIPSSGRILDVLAEPTALPAWYTQHDVDTYTAQFRHSGFTGGLNWYRNFDRNWLLTAPWRDSPVRPPALYVVGDRDGIASSPQAQQLLAGPTASVPNLRRAVLLPGAGHWTQQERPTEVTEALLGFLRSV